MDSHLSRLQAKREHHYKNIVKFTETVYLLMSRSIYPKRNIQAITIMIGVTCNFKTRRTNVHDRFKALVLQNTCVTLVKGDKQS